jgi:hypothetical protein
VPAGAYIMNWKIGNVSAAELSETGIAPETENSLRIDVVDFQRKFQILLYRNHISFVKTI